MSFQFMTPEERFTLIENTLKYAAELHAQHAEGIAKLEALHKGLVVAVGKLAEGQRRTDEKLHALIETVDRIIRDRGTSS